MARMGAWLDRAIEAGILGVLLFAPLPLGSVVPWASWTLVAAILVLGALVVARMMLDETLALTWHPLIAPGLAMALVVAVQLLRPGGTTDPYATRQSGALYVAYLGFLLLTARHLVTRARVLRLLGALVGCGTLLALLGLLRQLGWHQAWLGMDAVDPTDGRLAITFLNPNHQALYFGLTLFLAWGLLLAATAPRPATPASNPARPRPARPRTVAPSALALRIALGGAMGVLGVALLLTGSRGGLTSAWVGMVVVLGLLWGERRWVPLLVLLGGLAAIAGLTASGPGLDPLVSRFSELGREPGRDLRWALWGASVRMAMDHPWLGTGLGSFADVFARRGVPVPGLVVDHAHNDYLQLWVEAGAVGLGLLAWAIAALGAFVLRRRAARRDRLARNLAVAGIGAVAVAVVHSLVDFGLHLPGNALLLVAIAALLPAVVALRRDGGGEWTDLPTWTWTPPRAVRMAGGALAAGGVLVATLVAVPRALADWELHAVDRLVAAAAQAPRMLTLAELDRAWAGLRRAARLDPGQPVIQAAVGGIGVDLASRIWTYGVIREDRHVAASSPRERLAAAEPYLAAALEAYERSLMARPGSGEVRDRYAWFLGGLDSVRRTVQAAGLRPGDARLAPLLGAPGSLVPRALGEIQAAVSQDPLNPARRVNLALFALVHLGGGPEGRGIAVRAFHEALLLDPRLIDDVASHLTARADRLALLPAAIPARHDLWRHVASVLEDKRRPTEAATAWALALGLAPTAPQRLEVQLAYIRALVRRGETGAALVQAQQALAAAPTAPDVLLALAEVHASRREWSDAETWLAQAVRIAERDARPRVRELRSRLATYLADRGRHADAIHEWREIIRAAPNDAWAHFGAGRSFEQLGEWLGAYAEYRTAEQLGVRDGWLNTAVARVYARHDLLREASVAYRRAIALRPGDRAELEAELRPVLDRLERQPDASRPRP